jgi:hypothetical protein
MYSIGQAVMLVRSASFILHFEKLSDFYLQGILTKGASRFQLPASSFLPPASCFLPTKRQRLLPHKADPGMTMTERE